MPDTRLQTRSLLLWWSLFFVAVVLIYSGTPHFPLVYDDLINIKANPSILSLTPIWKPLIPVQETTYGGRPVTNFGFALTYALSGVHP